jgi:hypothetical protein
MPQIDDNITVQEKRHFFAKIVQNHPEFRHHSIDPLASTALKLSKASNL